jgi:hypothetical protein
MSNYLAIATVTTALKQILQVAASAAVQGAVVTTQRPESAQGQGVPDPTINLYLFQVAPNAAWRNADLPTRRADGTFLNRPLAALDMHYLLTFYGNDSELEPQRLVGNALSALTAHPILTRTDIARIVQAVDYLKDSDLADQVESVRLSPLSLNLEEMSKLWSVFFQTPYALSVAYQACVVLIQSEATPQPALPVRARYVYGATFRQSVIEEVMSAEGENEPIVAGGSLVIRGRHLRGDQTTVAFDGEEVVPSSVRDTEVSVTLTLAFVPAEVLRAGVHGVQVVHAMMMGVPATAHRGVSSNVTAFVLRPTIVPLTEDDVEAVANVVVGDDDLRSAELTVRVTPQVGQDQRVLLLMNELASQSPAAYSFTAPSRVADTNTLTIAISGVKPGDYLVRVQIDGAESPLEVADPLDPEYNGPEYTGPTVTIP